MKTINRRGITLLELTVVILILLSLISILFISVLNWKDARHRSTCIMNVRHAQQAVRRYQNEHGLKEGDLFGLKDLVGQGKLLGEIPQCPTGNYVFDLDEEERSSIPAEGEAWLRCNDSKHKPEHSNW
jgi:type II secretory pathway pseudopilin PulG